MSQPGRALDHFATMRSSAHREFCFFYKCFFEARIVEAVKIEVILTVVIYGLTPARPFLNPPAQANKGDTIVDDCGHL